MDQLFPPVGSACFGIFVGFVFRYFLERFETYDVKKLTTVLTIPLGSTLLIFIKDFGANSRPAYTVGLVLGLVLYQAFYAGLPSLNLPFRREKSGLLTRIEVSDVVTLLDITGTNATWTRTQTMKFNRDGNEVLISKTGGSGHVNPIRVTSREHVVEMDVRRGYVYARFPTPIRKGSLVEITLESEIKDSFLKDLEWFEHQVLQNTRSLTIEVRFPDARKCQQAELIKIFGADEYSIKKIAGGKQVRAPVPVEMHIAEAYRLSWNW
jgi:hypothetical protein